MMEKERGKRTTYWAWLPENAHEKGQRSRLFTFHCCKIPNICFVCLSINAFPCVLPEKKKKRSWNSQERERNKERERETGALNSGMGCCVSQLAPTETHPEKEKHQNHGRPPPSSVPAAAVAGGGAEPGIASSGVPSFSEFSYADLKTATNNFSTDFIVSESGEKAPNVVYKGRLQNRRWIAVKKFPKLAWPDPKQFAVFCLSVTYIILLHMHLHL